MNVIHTLSAKPHDVILLKKINIKPQCWLLYCFYHNLLTESWEGSSHSTVDVPPKLLMRMSTPGVLLVVWVVLLYTNLEVKPRHQQTITSWINHPLWKINIHVHPIILMERKVNRQFLYWHNSNGNVIPWVQMYLSTPYFMLSVKQSMTTGANSSRFNHRLK